LNHPASAFRISSEMMSSPVIWFATVWVMLIKPQSDFLIASDVTYSKTVARGSNVASSHEETTIPKSWAEEEETKREPKAEKRK
jgi:hypothetical protein